jgi:hypothetical protein
MADFEFPKDIEELTLRIFDIADRYDFVSGMIRCRHVGIYIRHHGLEVEPGYHILRIAQDVEKVVNDLQRYSLEIEGTEITDFLDDDMPIDDVPYFLLAVCVASDHVWLPCSIVDNLVGTSRKLYTDVKVSCVPSKKKGKKGA